MHPIPGVRLVAFRYPLRRFYAEAGFAAVRVGMRQQDAVSWTYCKLPNKLRRVGRNNFATEVCAGHKFVGDTWIGDRWHRGADSYGPEYSRISGNYRARSGFGGVRPGSVARNGCGADGKSENDGRTTLRCEEGK